MILAYIISNSADEAEEIAIDLIEKKLVYSVNIIPDIYSMKREGDKVMKLKRTIVLCKTKSLLYRQIEEEVERVQTSDSTIIFSMPMTQVSQNLFDQIQANTLKI